MTRVLLLAAALGLTVSAAGACEYQKSVQAKVDSTVVASIATEGQAPMSTVDDAKAATDTVIKQAVE